MVGQLIAHWMKSIQSSILLFNFLVTGRYSDGQTYPLSAKVCKHEGSHFGFEMETMDMFRNMVGDTLSFLPFESSNLFNNANNEFIEQCMRFRVHLWSYKHFNIVVFVWTRAPRLLLYRGRRTKNNSVVWNFIKIKNFKINVSSVEFSIWSICNEWHMWSKRK